MIDCDDSVFEKVPVIEFDLAKEEMSEQKANKLTRETRCPTVMA